MILYRTRKKTNEEIYEGNIRSDFSASRSYAYALVVDEVCLLIGDYFDK
jgi:hypothetical protein